MNKRLLKSEGKVLKGANIRISYSIAILMFPLAFLSISRSIFNPHGVDDFYYSLILIVLSVNLIYFLLIKKIINNIKIRKYGKKVKANVLGINDDRDEKCSIDFNNFLDLLKINDQ